jgi:hypothetical protein
MNGDNAPKEFQIYPWGKEIDEEVKNTLGREKQVGESEALVLRKLIPPKNTKILWRNEGVTTKGSWAALMVVLEKRRVKKSEGVRRVKSVWVYEPTKTRQSGFVWTDKTALEKLRPFEDNLRTRIGLKQEIKIHFKDKTHLGWEILTKGILIWTTIRTLLAPRNLGPTPCIGIWEHKKLVERSGEDLEKMWS